MPRRTILFILVLALVAPIGCSSSVTPVPVSGTITVRKKPEANLLIQFTATQAGSGKPASGSATSKDDGKFEIVGDAGKPGLPPGEYDVTVVDRNSEISDEDLAKGKRAGPSRVDARYLSPGGKNTLKVKVEAGKTTYDLVLE